MIGQPARQVFPRLKGALLQLLDQRILNSWDDEAHLKRLKRGTRRLVEARLWGGLVLIKDVVEKTCQRHIRAVSAVVADQSGSGAWMTG
eukprot:7384626-Prymnesium_polylepis.1